MKRTLGLLAIACTLSLVGCARKAPPPEHGGSSSDEPLPEPTDNSALDESDETPEQPELAPSE